MLKKFVQIVGGDPNKRQIEEYAKKAELINALEAEYEALDEKELAQKTNEFRNRLKKGETLDDILVESFAVVREASKRTIGLRHYDVQLIGGMALHEGKIVEMRTGEGKTLVATLPIYLNALTGEGVHLVTVNDYLARRDARWMAPIFDTLGLSVGVLQMAARTENGKKAFLVDLSRESPHEDQNQLVMVQRRLAYQADITYGTNNEFGFDYLRDNMTMRLEDRVQRGFNYAIIDEVDNVLIDEARTPLIISGPAQDEAEWYIKMSQIVKRLNPEDYEIEEKDRTVTLTEIGEAHVEELIGIPLRDPDRPEDITPEQARLLGYLEQALRAQFLYKRNKDYLVQAGKVIIIDEFTGRLMPGRRWSDGLHQAVEAKEGVKVQSESVTYATITIQNYFRMYKKLAGMTGTAVTEAEEFNEIYSLDVLALPTNLEYEASKPDTDLITLEGRDEENYKYTYYVYKDDPDKKPVFWKRKDYPDVVYRTEEAKLRSIVKEILRYHVLGRPLLIGTTSVELSEQLSLRLRADSIRRLTTVMLLRNAWIQSNNREEDGRKIPELQFLNTPLKELNTTEMRKLARELGISFNPQNPENIQRLLQLLNLPPEYEERLNNALQGGISHQVLNARKHTEESQIIAGAGAFGAVTIATNMAGRGVDIKLGGELAEEIISSVNRVLKKAGYDNAYQMSMEEKYQATEQLSPSDYGIYDSEINFFKNHINEMEQVRILGGLHVIGSERHDARRIDNQLRGRAGRQGDPGSSRFYLSMEDELMRLFGGGQADALMQRMKIDDSLPLEMGIVSKIVEQAQTRVEGANFDVRKHLLEYDDVLNTQRVQIYQQRDLIFTKDDLTEDVTEMLRTEIARRVPEALEDNVNPWRLIAWLEQIQPSIIVGDDIYPSFAILLLLDKINSELAETASQEEVFEALIEIAQNAIDAERNHIINSVDELLENTYGQLQSQIDERMQSLDIFFEGLSLDEETEQRSLNEIQSELISIARVPIKLSPAQLRQLQEDPYELEDEIKQTVTSSLQRYTTKRVIGAVERRLEEPLTVEQEVLSLDDWVKFSSIILDAVDQVFNNRLDRYLGTTGQIRKDINKTLAKLSFPLNQNTITRLLLLLPQGSQAEFDKKTHKKVLKRTTRLTYVYYAANLIMGNEEEQIEEDVLEHLENAQAFLRSIWGRYQFERFSALTFADLDDQTQSHLKEALGEETFNRNKNQPLEKISPEDTEIIIDEFGRKSLTEIYRQLLLRIITELWVEYLTQMEALRVSIGLEAYAQRDPLVQYKNRAFELFQNLFNDMRTSVINRMFTYQPANMNAVQESSHRAPTAAVPAMLSSLPAQNMPKSETPAAVANSVGATPANNNAEKTTSKSSRRRRRRKKKK